MSEEKAPSLRTLQADVAALDPLDFPCDLLHRERCPAPNGSSSVARSDRRV